MSNGNGNFAGQIDPGGPLDGQKMLFIEPVSISDDLARAIDWLKHGDKGGRHRPGCQCTPCINSRRVTLSRLSAFDECTCGWCPVCWALSERRKRRL